MMDKNPFSPDFKKLPENIPVFPLTGVLLMPFGQLPLNIFEPRYLNMVRDALATHRMIGMIQPREHGADELYDVGCAGKITEFSETEDGRFLISLTGICRFRTQGEIKSDTAYRLFKTNWNDFENDLSRKACLDVDRERLKALLSKYFEQEDMSCDFSKFDDTPDGKLITCLAMVCPFEPREKQALLEQVCCVNRAKLFMEMLEMAVQSDIRPDMSKKNCH